MLRMPEWYTELPDIGYLLGRSQCALGHTIEVPSQLEKNLRFAPASCHIAIFFWDDTANLGSLLAGLQRVVYISEADVEEGWKKIMTGVLRRLFGQMDLAIQFEWEARDPGPNGDIW